MDERHWALDIAEYADMEPGAVLWERDGYALVSTEDHERVVVCIQDFDDWFVLERADLYAMAAALSPASPGRE